MPPRIRSAEEVDVRNHADQMVYQTEKTLKELGDKLPADVKSEAESKLADLKTAVQSGNVDDIKAKQDDLRAHVFEKMYQACRCRTAGRPVHSPAPMQVQTTSRSRVMTALWTPTSRKSDKQTQQCVPGQTGGRTRRNSKSRSGFAGAALAGL